MFKKIEKKYKKSVKKAAKKIVTEGRAEQYLDRLSQSSGADIDRYQEDALDSAKVVLG